MLDRAALDLMIDRGYVRRACRGSVRRAYATLSLSPDGLDLSNGILATILRLPGEHQSM
jgi:hypothetical protein